MTLPLPNAASTPSLPNETHAVQAAWLLPYQQRWLMDPARVKVFEKSRRIGITWSTAAHCVLEAASGRQDCWYVIYSEDGAKEFIRDCAEWAERFDEPAKREMVELIEYDEDGTAQNIRALSLTFPGSPKRIIALTSNPRSLRGKQGLVVIDEAAFHDDLAALLKAAFALLMWGGQVWVLSTHDGEQNAFAQLCNDIRDGKKDYSLHRCTITDAIEEGLYRRICATQNEPWSLDAENAWLAKLERDYGDGAREELYCEPSSTGAVYLSSQLVREAMYDAPVLRYTQTDAFMGLSEDERRAAVAEWLDAAVSPLLEQVGTDPEYRTFALGLDFGRVADLTVLAPMGLRQNMARRVPFMVELANVPFNQQWQVVEYVISRLPHFLDGYFDASGNGSWVAEQAYLRFGTVIERVMLNQAFYRDHMPALKQAFEDRAIQIPRDLDVAADLAMVRRVNGIPKVPDVRTDGVASRRKRHGDAAIALFLANVACTKAEELFKRWEAYTTM